MKILKIETEKDWDKFCQETREDYDLVIVSQRFIGRIRELSKKKQQKVEMQLE